MKTDPFTDTFMFLLGNTDDHEKLGPLRYVFVASFALLLIASVAIAIVNWRRDPSQRSAGDLGLWACRVLMGSMWFQGSIWKLPLPVSGGLQYWTEQMAQNAAFAWFGDLVRSVVLPNMALFDPVILLVELGLAVSFILGIAVGPVAALGVPYALGLWIGLYRNSAEWPWIYVFIAIVHVLFVIGQAGRSLGLDALRATGRSWRSGV